MADGTSIGSVSIEVNPDAAQFWTRFQAQTRTGASRAGDDIGVQVGKAIQDKIAKGLSDGIDKGSRDAAAKATKAGSDSGEAFGRGFKARLTEALRSLPKAKLDADSTDADRKLAFLRSNIKSLLDAKIGVDVDDATAVAKFNYIKTKANELRSEHPSIEVQAAVDQALAAINRVVVKSDEVASKSPSIRVDANTGRADAKLAATAAEAEAVGALDPTINVDVDSGAAVAGLAATSFAAEGASGSLFSLVNVGLLLGPALIPAAAGAAAALGALGAVAFAAGSAVAVIALAIAPVIAAVKAMGAAQTAAGSSAASAAGKQLQMAGAIDQVRTAQASLANTVANAADSQRRASESVQNAVLAETDAQRQLATAQQAVTQARIDATRAAQDLNTQIAHNSLDQRQAALDLQKAQQTLAVAKAGSGNSTSVAEAQLGVDEAAQRQKDLQVQQQRLEQDKATSDKRGIDGSTQVVAALDRVRQATEAVHKAEQATADARIAYAAQERQNEFAVAQAKQGVVNAQRAVQQASVSAGTAGAAATNKLTEAMAALSPAGQAFARFLFGLKGVFVDLSKAAQTGFLPGLQAGIEALLPVMPQITAFVGALATVMGELARQALTALASPFWQDFFAQMSAIAIPLLQQMGPLFGDVAKGFAGLFLAFAPFAPKIIGWLAGLAEKFAAWSTTLSTNSAFQAFVDYVNTNGPLLVGTLGGLAVTAGKLLVALAPLGQLILTGLYELFNWLSKLSPGQLIAVAAGIGAIAASIAILAGGPITLIIAGLVAVVGALTYAYQNVSWFRTVVDVAFHAIAAVVTWWWQTVVFPVFNWLKAELPVVGEFFTRLWTTYAGPAFRGIGAVIGAVSAVIKPIFDAWVFWLTTFVGPVFLLLWHAFVQPAWQGIQLIISIAWAAIQVTFGLIQIGLKILGASFRALYDLFIRPTWDAIRPVLEVLGSYLNDHVVPQFRTAIAVLGQIFNGLRDGFKGPIRFVIQTVLNDGLLGAYDWIASRFGVKPDNVHVALPSGFADGGVIPGTPSRTDNRLAMVATGEYIMPTDKTARYRPVLDAMRAGVLPGYAEGGIVGFAKSAWNTLSDPIGAVTGKVSELLRNIPGAGILTGAVSAISSKLIHGAMDFAGNAITRLLAAAGGGPPDSVDANVVAIAKQVGAAMHANAKVMLALFEAGLVESGMRNLNYGDRDSVGYLQQRPSQGWPSPMNVATATRSFLTRAIRNDALHPGYSAGQLAQSVQISAFPGRYDQRAGAAHALLGYDSGGYLPPGLTLAYNGTGRPEAIFTSEQMDALAGSRGGPTITQHIYPQPGQSEPEIAAAASRQLAWDLR